MKPDIHSMKQPHIMGGSNTFPQHDTSTAADHIDDRPRSVYEIVTRQMLEELKNSVAEVKGRVNTLLWLVAGAVVLELVVRLIR